MQAGKPHFAGFGELPDNLTRLAGLQADQIGVIVFHIRKLHHQCGVFIELFLGADDHFMEDLAGVAQREAESGLVEYAVAGLLHLAAGQGELLSSTPLTLAETASVFGEMLTFRRLLDGAKKEGPLSIYTSAQSDDMGALVAGFEKMVITPEVVGAIGHLRLDDKVVLGTVTVLFLYC